MKILLVLIIAFLSPCRSNAQSSYTVLDSLNVFAKLDRSDQLVTESAYDSAMALAKQALQFCITKKFLRGEANTRIKIADILLTKKDLDRVALHDSISLRAGLLLKDSLLIGLSYYQLGLLATYQQRFGDARQLFNKALQVHFEKAQSATTAVIYNDMGYMYGQMSDLEKQLEWLMKALRLYDITGDLWGKAQTLNNIATGLNEAGRPAESLFYFNQSIEIREKLNHKSGLAFSYNNAAQIYMGLDSLEKAVEYQKRGLMYAEMSEVPSTMIHSYVTMALLLNRQRKNAEALEYEKKAINLLEKKVDDNNQLSRRYIAAAILSGATKDSIGAVQYFKKALDLSLTINNKYNLRDINLHKAIFFKNRKDYYNAYEAYKAYIVYRDSIINTETLARMADIETKYQTEKKDRAIMQLNAAQKIRQLELEKQKAIISRNMLEAKRSQDQIDLLMRSTELQELRIQQQDEELEKSILLAQTREQQLQLAEKEKLLRDEQLQNQKQLRNGLIIGTILILVLSAVVFSRYQLKKKLEQQKELQNVRNHIAKDLHDEIGSTLTSINILSKVSRKSLDKDLAKSSAIIDKITEQSQNIQQAMSDIVWAIRPDNDLMENMLVRMREYVSHTLELKNIATDFDVSGNILQHPLAMEQRRDLFLIFKEAINNAAKYSQAEKVSIQLSRHNNHIQLAIKDNGIGFEPKSLTSSNGLKNMRERATALNGHISILSTPGKGTQISLEFPIEKVAATKG